MLEFYLPYILDVLYDRDVQTKLHHQTYDQITKKTIKKKNFGLGTQEDEKMKKEEEERLTYLSKL